MPLTNAQASEDYYVLEQEKQKLQKRMYKKLIQSASRSRSSRRSSTTYVPLILTQLHQEKK